MDLENRADRNKIRGAIQKARQDELLGQTEAGFIITLVERFRSDIEKKIKVLHQLQGEINQLRNNEKIIVDLIENIVAATERDKARQETFDRIREIKENSNNNKETDNEEKNKE